MGSAQISVTDVYKVIGYELFKIKKFSDYASGPIHDVIWLISISKGSFINCHRNGSYCKWCNYAGNS